jgi:hypothetical protein
METERHRMVILKVKIVQEYKESKIEMYKLIWGLALTSYFEHYSSKNIYKKITNVQVGRIEKS